jgi:hypothetical protein
MYTFRAWLITAAVMAALAACGSSDNGEGGPDAASAVTDQQLAAQFCAVEYGCFPDDWPSEQTCVDEVTSGLAAAENDSAACYAAMRGLVTCLKDLNCAQLDDYWTEPTPDYPCNEHDTAVDAACAG